MADIKIYTADRIFTGDTWLNDQAIITNGGVIDEILPTSALVDRGSVENFSGCYVAPGFIDLQIYGADKKLLAVYPDTDALMKLKGYCSRGGAAYCLPTVATNSREVFYKCIDAVRAYWKKGFEGVLGLHIEGPWINAVKKGAHIESFIHSPNMDEAKQLLEYGKDVIKMITLAPEVCDGKVIDYILSNGIIISAGHSNATYKEAKNAFQQGIRTATHLYNAMSPLQHREPGLVGAIFDSNVNASIIPDGHHVDYAAIRIAKNILQDRLFVITDAVTETSQGYYQHYLAGDKYESGGILSGSALNMNMALQNLVNHVGIHLDEALRMCSLYPARVVKKDNELGRIKAGYKAKLVVLDKNMQFVKLIE
jgi:N-acetylglucosamine-6-phosphate deacetylase